MPNIEKMRGFSQWASEIIYKMEIWCGFYFDVIGSYKDSLRFTRTPEYGVPYYFKLFRECERYLIDFAKEYPEECTREALKNGGNVL